MLKTRTIALGITNLSDARYFSAYNVDWMAFPSSDEADNFAEIKEMMTWVEGPQLAIELDKWDDALLSFAKESLPLNGVVVHDKDVGMVHDLEIIALHGSGSDGPMIVNRDDLDHLSEDDLSRVFLDTRDLSNSEVEALISSHPDIGIVLYGGVEEKVGYKSFDDQDALIDILMED
jgi:phosphoribosylanthranilate isomerase